MGWEMNADKPTVQSVLTQVRRLTMQEQLDLLEKIAVIVRDILPSRPTHSVLELEGLGAGIWKGVPAQEYVERERAASGWENG
jgi:hypothetical protein